MAGGHEMAILVRIAREWVIQALFPTDDKPALVNLKNLSQAFQAIRHLLVSKSRPANSRLLVSFHFANKV